MRSSEEFLYSLQKFGMKFGLRNIRALLHAVGDPHRSFPSIHVAGTNGKGSTSSMIAAILSAAGYTVGLYTSPHLVSFHERIRINGTPIDKDALDRYVRLLKKEIRRRHATFFEATTAIAFRYFADQKVDIAVIEAGLGGRLDSTNVITPLVSVITSIGKDHTEILGTTIAAIATEKGGIIKRGKPTVIGPLSTAARNVLRTIARRRHSPLIESAGMTIDRSISLELPGAHQRSNAKIAVAAVSLLGEKFLIGDAAVKQGLEQTRSLSGLRARLERIPGKPEVIVDVAHNPDGIRRLVSALRTLRIVRPRVIFAVMKDKSYRTMVRLLRSVDPVIYPVQPSTDRALSSDVLYDECVAAGLRARRTRTPAAALQRARAEAGKHGVIVVTGSHYLVGEMLPLVEKKS